MLVKTLKYLKNLIASELAGIISILDSDTSKAGADEPRVEFVRFLPIQKINNNVGVQNMNKPKLMCVYLIFLVLALLLHLEPVRADDHGDSFETATLVTVGSITSGRINLEDDQDFFKFTVSQRAKYVIFSRGITDVRGRLYDEQYSQMTYDYNDGEEDNFRIEYDLSPGTYYLRVIGYWNTVGDYAVHIEGPGHGTTSDDHGASPWSATPIAVSSAPLGRIDIPGDRDFFAFTASRLALFTLFTDGITNTSGLLYNSQYSELTHDNNDGDKDNFRIEYTLTPGLYYVEIKGDYSQTYGNYKFHISGPYAPPPGQIQQPPGKGIALPWLMLLLDE